MKTTIVKALVGLSLAVFVNSCDSDGSGNCGKVAACGGDIVGEWSVVDTCLSFAGAPPTGDFCPTATIDAGGINVSGKVSYKADMTFSTMLTISGSMAMELPASCLTVEGITLTCAQVDQAVKQAFAADPDPSIQSISCAGMGSCRCTFVMAPQSSTSSGTYTTSGTTVSENGSAGTPYCVQGNELHISDMSMGTGTLSASGGLVLKR
jgi:hypothetical protein